MISSFAKNYLRQRSTELMIHHCVITRPGSSRVVYDPVTRSATNVAGSAVYEGVCRLWEIPSGTRIDWGDDHVVVSNLALSLPWDAPVPEIHDRVLMTVHDDPTVLGKSLTVERITRGGGLRGSRVLSVSYVDSEKEEW